MGGEASSTEHGPLSTRWTRAGAIAGLIAAVLLVVNLVLLSSFPAADSPGRTIAADLWSRHAVALAASYAGFIGSMTVIPFVASLRAFTQRPDGEAQWRWTVTLLSAAAVVSLIAVGSASLAAAAVLAGQTADESAVGALFAAAKACLTFALTPMGAVILANARTLSSRKTPVRWLIRFDLEVGILALVSSAAIFIHGAGFGAGEQVVAGVGLIVVFWVAAVAIVMLEGEKATVAS
jgi:hypothetical protein